MVHRTGRESCVLPFWYRRTYSFVGRSASLLSVCLCACGHMSAGFFTPSFNILLFCFSTSDRFFRLFEIDTVVYVRCTLVLNDEQTDYDICTVVGQMGNVVVLVADMLCSVRILCLTIKLKI